MAVSSATLPGPVDNHVPTLQIEWYPEWRQKYREQHPRGRLSRVAAYIVSYFYGTPIRGVPFDDDEVPEWLQRRKTNEARCTLYRLPDEILLRICRHSDAVTQSLLRQTCSLFLRMVIDLDRRDRVLGQQLPYIPRIGLHSLLWNLDVFRSLPLRPSPLCYSDRHLQAVRVARARADERFCAACQAFRASGAFAEALRRLRSGLWCAGCRTAHPGYLFSAAQRAAAPAQRICIGREGRVVLCEHVSIGWQDFCAAPRQRFQCLEHPSALQWSALAMLPDPTAEWRGGCFNMSWMVPAFDVDPAVPVTRAHLRSFLAAQGRGNPSRFSRAGFCPHVAPDDGRLLLPFEPGQCVCFADPATKPDTAEPCAFHAERLRHLTTADDQCCRCRARIRDEGITGYYGRFLPANTVHSVPNETFQHTYVCQVCEARYSWVRPTGSRVYMHFSSNHCFLSGPASANWLRRLHPDTWAATEDQALHRVAWCAAPQCHTGTFWTRILQRPPRSPTGTFWASFPQAPSANIFGQGRRVRT